MINDLVAIAKAAGQEILNIYEQADFDVDFKADKSPLTSADTASNHLICDELSKKFPDIPVLSEENKIASAAERASWKEYFVIDPLDGTKEFINKNGEFTVNIALIKDNKPVLGVVYVPVWDEVYYAEKDKGAFLNNEPLSQPTLDFDNITAVVSRSHSSEVEQKLLAEMGASNTISVGSSIKFCWLASGKAQAYVRKTPLMVWDLSAAYVVATEMGIVVKDFEGNDINFSDLTINGIKAAHKQILS